MKPERSQQVDEIFQSALDLAPELRAAYLDRACAGDPGLRREVESLISAYEQSGSFIERPAIEVDAQVLAGRSAHPVAGQSISNYRIVELLGAGGMGEVYLAEDTRLGRKVALKLLPDYFTRDQERVRRFQQEARAVLTLNHPGIVTTYEIGKSGQSHFIATEYIEGETLRARMAHERMGMSEGLDVAIQVAGALAAAHQAGIIHRDIKPENIMVRRDGYVKVLDFGLAKLTERAPARGAGTGVPAISLPNTEPGIVMGTVGYMSPEQTRGLEVDARTDIWSLGVVLYEMAAGRTPFEGPTPSDVIAAILERGLPPLARYAPGVPAELERIVAKALAKEGEERYQTVKDLLTDLRRLKKRLEFEDEMRLAASPEPDGRAVRTVGGGQRGNATAPPASTAEIEAAHTTSSAEYLLTGIKRHKVGAALAALVIGAGGFAFTLSRFFNQQATSLPQITVTRLTSTGQVNDAAISPDGKYVVHVVIGAGQQSLRVRHVATTSNVEIIPPAEVEYRGLTFSPDGNYVYYVRTERNNPCRVLYQVPVLGGPSKKLTADVHSEITFSPDGKRFAFVRHSDPGKMGVGESALMIANADGGGERTLATRQAPEYFISPAWSPDGEIIACSARGLDGTGHYMNIVGVSVDSGIEKPITSGRWFWMEKIVWLFDGSGLLALAGDEPGRKSTHIWQLPYPNGEARRITTGSNEYYGLSVAADANALVTIEQEPFVNIWSVPVNGGRGLAAPTRPAAPGGLASGALPAGVSVDTNQARQLTSGGKYEGWMGISWTPDGNIIYAKIVYGSSTWGKVALWMMNADGSNQRQVTDPDIPASRPTVSPDGRYILFSSGSYGASHIWRIDAGGGNPKQLTDSRDGDYPDCSPDGLWVVYSSVNSGKETLWKVPIDGGDPVQLTDKFSTQPVISPDGKLVACLYRDDPPDSPWQMAVIPMAGGAPVKTFALPATLRQHIRWAPDGRALTYIATRGGVSNIWSQPVDGGAPRQVTDFKSGKIFNFNWSRDGKWLACSRGELTWDAVLIRGFKQ